MKKVVVGVMFITVLAKVLGFAKELLLSYFFGATGITDAYYISQTIPGNIFQFVGTGLATCFIPIFLQIVNTEGEEKAKRFTNTVLTAVFLFSTVITILVFSNTAFFVKIFASGFTGDTLEKAIFFTRIGIFSLYFSTIIYVSNSYLQIKNHFTYVAFTAIPNSIMILLAIVAGATIDVIWLPIGSIMAVAVQACFLLFMDIKEGLKVRLNVNFKDSYVKQMLKMMVPVTVGVSINELNVLIDKTVASRVAVGGISSLAYAESLVMFVQGIFVQTIASVYYPKMTETVESNHIEDAKSIIKEAIQGMFYLLAPITVGCMIMSNDVVRILYERGNFGAEAVQMTSIAFLCYTIGIIGYGFREIFSRVFYAFHDTKTPMLNSGIGVAINIVLNLTLSPIIGIGGLALATSISSIVTSILLYANLRKKHGEILQFDVSMDFMKIICISLLMGVVVFILRSILIGRFGIILCFITTVLLGIVFYLIASVVCKVEVVNDLLKKIMRR